MSRSKKILLVEDELLIATAEKITLEKHGYEVTIASTGERAIEITVQQPNFDLILMDINLGSGIDGTDAAKEILNQREVPVVFLSSHTDPAVVDKTEKITSYGYIVKNSGETVLLASIRMAFRLFEEKKRVQAREHLLSSVLNSIQDGISVLDTDLRIQHVNEVMRRWYPEKESINGRLCHEVYHRRREPCSSCPSLRALKSGATEREEVPGRSDSPVEWLELFSYPMKDPDTGEMLGVVEFVRDVTERRRLSKALQESERQLDMLFSQSLHGFFICMMEEPVAWNDSADKESILDYALKHQKIVRVNQALLDQYGAAEEGFIGTTVETLLADDMSLARDIMRTLFDTGMLRAETQEHRVDGTPIVIDGDYVCMYDEQGRITGHFGVQVDVTNRKLQEGELEEERYLLSSILEAAPVGIWLVDQNQNPLLVNEEFIRNTGFGTDSFSMTPDEISTCKNTDDITIRSGIPQKFEETVTYTDGTKHILETIKTPLKKKDGSVWGILGIGVDITERKEAESSVYALLKEKELFLRETHHRIKNNFATIESLLSIQSEYNPAARHVLTEARGQIAKYRVLYEKLLRTENYQSIPARSYLNEIAAQVLRAHDVSGRMRYDEEIQEAELTARTAVSLGTIIVELLTNSIKYAHHPDGSGAVKLTFLQDGNQGVLRISDEGAGLPEGFNILETESFGLLLVRMTAEQIGGTFTIESSPGNGTLSTVVFPLELNPLRKSG